MPSEIQLTITIKPNVKKQDMSKLDEYYELLRKELGTFEALVFEFSEEFGFNYEGKKDV